MGFSASKIHFQLRDSSLSEVQILKIFRLRRAFPPPRWGEKKLFSPPRGPDPGGGNICFSPPRGPDPGGEKNLGFSFLPPSGGGKTPLVNVYERVHGPRNSSLVLNNLTRSGTRRGFSRNCSTSCALPTSNCYLRSDRIIAYQRYSESRSLPPQPTLY